ncbi:uncharacterized protein LOC109720015 [Ananas comosus]|uniref:Uncharacterized protein LOC109720015 n=1 Tax=Ananas comosus TaxID=4615 RepID=A0A6P5GAY2_ANACO|nr:uncharacterized protein LOC109720015 [Ananas comosus]
MDRKKYILRGLGAYLPHNLLPSYAELETSFFYKYHTTRAKLRIPKLLPKLLTLSLSRSHGGALQNQIRRADSLRRRRVPPAIVLAHHAGAVAAAVRLLLRVGVRVVVLPRSAPHPARSVSVAERHLNRRRGGGDGAGAAHPKTCLCSPTTHPGSFRCSLHKGYAVPPHGGGGGGGRGGSVSAQLNMRRSAMANSLVRIGAVEGEWVRRALTAPIRPSSHQLRRRAAYQPRPSRLSTMSAAEGADL